MTLALREIARRIRDGSLSATAVCEERLATLASRVELGAFWHVDGRRGARLGRRDRSRDRGGARSRRSGRDTGRGQGRLRGCRDAGRRRGPDRDSRTRCQRRPPATTGRSRGARQVRDASARLGHVGPARPDGRSVATRSIPPCSRAARRAARRSPSRRTSFPLRWAATPEARSASRQHGAASWATSRPREPCRGPASCRYRPRSTRSAG